MKSNLFLMFVVGLALFTLNLAGCGGGDGKNTYTTVKQETLTITVPVFHNVTAHVPVYNNITTRVPVFHNVTAHVSVFRNVTAHVASYTPPATLIKSILYKDATIQSGLSRALVGSAQLTADNGSDVVIDKLTADFKLLGGNFATLRNISVWCNGVQVGPTIDYTNINTDSHTPTEFTIGALLLNKGTTIALQVFADTAQADSNVKFAVTMRASGKTISGQKFSTEEVECQTISIGKPDVSLATNSNQGNNETGATSGTHIIPGMYKFNPAPDWSISSMTFTVNGYSAVNRVNVWGPRPNASPEIVGSAVVTPTDNYGYSGQAIIKLNPTVSLASSTTIFASIFLNNQVGVNVGLNLTQFEATNSKTGGTATFTVNEAGAWVMITKSQPVFTLASLPNTSLTDVTTGLRWNITAVGGDLSWKQQVFVIKTSAITISSFAIIDNSTGAIVPGHFKRSEAVDYDGSKVIKLTFESANETVIAAEATATYSFRFNLWSSIVPGSFVQISIVGNTNNGIGRGNYANMPGESSFIWSDLSAGNDHSENSNDWYNEKLAKGLPLIGPATYR
jgi:hypothetical protein